MLLLKNLVDLARNLKAHDIHIMPPQLNESVILLRHAKKCLHRQRISSLDWSQLIEYLKFHSYYRYEHVLEFQDTKLCIFDTHLRLAFSPGHEPYLTCRLHFPQPLIPLDPLIEEMVINWFNNNALLMIVGPVKSGKTTLYYEILRQAAQAEKTIISLEDPIERVFTEFSQQSVRDNNEVSKAAQSLLRFDMDIIGVGEIRSLSVLNTLTYLNLSSINTICTLHATSIESLRKKLKMLSLDDYERFYYSFYGVILLKDINQKPLIYYKNHDLFNNIFAATSF
jgi:type II secretory ATPase GspE/PulE/Tfp pilus assembly ATPase PilB-like protein